MKIKEHSNLYWWLFDRVPSPVYRAWQRIKRCPRDIKANKLRKQGKVPAKDAWNSDITICDMLAQHLKWHLRWLDEQHKVFPAKEEDLKYKAEMERAYKALSGYENVHYACEPASKRQLQEVKWAIHWVAKNIRGLWY